MPRGPKGEKRSTVDAAKSAYNGYQLAEQLSELRNGWEVGLFCDHHVGSTPVPSGNRGARSSAGIGWYVRFAAVSWHRPSEMSQKGG